MGDKQRTSQYPIRKLSLDHEKIGGVSHFLSLVVFTSVAHSSPSLTASLATHVPKRSPFSEISISQKSERDN